MAAGAEPRLRRAESPSSPRRRASSADDIRYRLATRLTERDRCLLRELECHGVFTAGPIAALFFGSESRARARLILLHDSLGVIARFRPHAPGWGSAPFHYTLNRRGAGVVAAERGEDPAVAERRWSTGRVLALAGSQRLRHTMGVNGFYAALVARARRRPDAELVRWLTEPEAAVACRSPCSTVRADGWGLWAEAGERVEFFLSTTGGPSPLAGLSKSSGATSGWNPNAAWPPGCCSHSNRPAARTRRVERWRGQRSRWPPQPWTVSCHRNSTAAGRRSVTLAMLMRFAGTLREVLLHLGPHWSN
jgi:hypothetical protein